MTPSLPSGHTLLVVVDYCSRYFEVEFLKLTTTDKVIASLDKMFLIHGFPKEITTDNGPQFISKEFEDYLEMQGIKHRKVTPLWPQANGKVERQNRSLLKRLKISQIEKRDWKDEVQGNNEKEQPEAIDIPRERPVRTRRAPARFKDFDVTWK